MPYIVTTTRSRGAERCRFGRSHSWHRRLNEEVDDCTVCGAVSDEAPICRAVSTLDEARRAVYEVHRHHDSTSGVHTRTLVRDAIGDTGGSVGPLPDGTTISVEPVTTNKLYGDLSIDGQVSLIDSNDPGRDIHHGLLCAAWNEKHGAVKS